MNIGRVVMAGVVMLALERATPSIAAPADVAVGIKVGGQLLRQFTGSTDVSNSSRLIVGPSMEVTLTRGFALEFDALLKRMNNHTQSFGPAGSTELGVQTITFDTTARAWEFPVVLKKYIDTSPNVRIFPEAGVSLRRTTGMSHFQTTPLSCFLSVACQPSSGTVNSSDVVNLWTGGPVVGAGMDLHKGPVHVHPELRYTLWVGRAFSSPAYGTSNAGALDLLLGISFGK